MKKENQKNKKLYELNLDEAIHKLKTVGIDLDESNLKGDEEKTIVLCFRCNGNGCPACDGTKGSGYNPEPY